MAEVDTGAGVENAPSTNDGYGQDFYSTSANASGTVSAAEAGVDERQRVLVARYRELLYLRRKEKERKQRRKVITVAVVAVIVLVLAIGVSVQQIIAVRNQQRSITEKDAYTALQQVSVSPEYADDTGGILISRNGYGAQIDNVPTIQIFMDPICPGCAEFHQQMDSTLEKMVDAGQINLVLHPIAYFDHLSSDNYSSRVTGVIAYIADHDSDPEHLLHFLQNIYADDFVPEELPYYKPVSNDKIREQAVNAGVPDLVAKRAFGGQYKEWVKKCGDYTLRRKDLQNKTGKYAGKVTTPTIVCNGRMIDDTKISDNGHTYKQAILHMIGLNDTQIGNPSQLPALGANKA